MFSAALSFIENSLRWLLNRKICNPFGIINAIISSLFIIACIYKWLWANDAAGIAFICLFFTNFNRHISPEQLRPIIYDGVVKLLVDLAVSWLLPL